MSEAHLARYLAEFDRRYDGRPEIDPIRTDAMLKATTDKRLTYRRSGEAANA